MGTLASITTESVLLVSDKEGQPLSSWRVRNIADRIEWVVGVDKGAVVSINRVNGHEVIGHDEDGAARVRFWQADADMLDPREVVTLIALLNADRYGLHVRSARRLAI